MTISSRSNHFISHSTISRFQTLIFNLKRLNHTLACDQEKAIVHKEIDLESASKTSTCDNDICVDTSTWRVVDSRNFGINHWRISPSSRTALTILQEEGFEAYLVGGCVRDLLLDKIPRDFDVITNANLNQIKKYFHHARIVGQRFPICKVFIKGSVVEVSSFDTVAKHAEEKETISLSQEPIGCDRKDFVRWQNCLRRDFTINSLFYDPSVNKIYDYANGMRDLKLCKVQTVIPAHLSFKEDCARILRGLRIAARLGLSFSEETSVAIQNLYLSITDLNKARLMMEMDYMLSYGAAVSSLCLLKRFKILDIVLPFHAAYLHQQAYVETAESSPMLFQAYVETAESSPMLFKLFSCVDKLVSCDRPSSNCLWVGVLAFHLALVNNPQDALVIWALSSVLYHGNWSQAVKFAREKSEMPVRYSPEISESCGTKSDEALAKDVNRFASQVISSIDALTESECLVQSMKRYPLWPGSGLVFISKYKGHMVAKLFDVLLDDIESYQKRRKSFEIKYELLKKGNCDETRFVLGKIIMDTLSSGFVQEKKIEVVKEIHLPPSSYMERQRNTVEQEKNCLLSSHLERQQVVEKERSWSKESKKKKKQGGVKQEKDRSQKSNTNVISSSHLEQKQKLDEKINSCLTPSHLEQQQKVVEKGKKSSTDAISSSYLEEQRTAGKKGKHRLMSSHLEKEQMIKKEKGRSQKLNTNVSSSSQPRKTVEKKKNCPTSSHFVQQEKMTKEDYSLKSKAKWKEMAEKGNQSFPIYKTVQRQQVVDKEKHHLPESNQEQQEVVMKKPRKLSTLFM